MASSRQHKATLASGRVCVAWSCSNPLPPGSRADRMFCSDTCQRKVTRARQRARQRRIEGEPPTRTDLLLAQMGLAEEMTDGETRSMANVTTPAAEERARNGRTPLEVASSVIPPTLGGAGFQRFAATDLPRLINEQVLDAASAADKLRVSRPTMSEWMALYNAATAQDRASRNWADDPAAQSLREYALSSFRAFNEVFFPDILVPDFHGEWDEEMTRVLDDGGRVMLLGPQRHGKTSFMVRQLLYRIARNPNICAMVVGKTADLATKTTGVVRQYLENDPQFASVLLPPDTGFKPPSRRGLPWTNSEFTVASRTEIRKSPTVVALGVGGTILSRDADLILIDDPVDRKGMLSPTERENVAEWFFTDFNSRIEEHTGVAYIGSRQHKDDLPGRLIQKNAERMAEGNDPDWKVLLYRAHDLNCPTPLDEHDEDQTDCILWPEYRTAQWLAKQQRNNPEHFQRNYQNSPSSDAFKPVGDDDIEWSYRYDEWLSSSPRSPLYDKDHTTPRIFSEPHAKTRIVASVDPAVAKKNAAVLWSYTTTPIHLPKDPSDPDSPLVPVIVRAVMDYEEPPPGSPGVVEILKQWHDTYGVVDWVFETNYFADQIANDRDINDSKSRRGLKFHTHYTSPHNKHDPRAGVLAMLNSMRSRPTGLLLPGATPQSRRAMDRLVHQMMRYDPESTHYASGRKRTGMDDDLIMAAWFGWYWIESQAKTRSSQVQFQYGTGFGDFAPSHWANVPWKDIA